MRNRVIVGIPSNRQNGIVQMGSEFLWLAPQFEDTCGFPLRCVLSDSQVCHLAAGAHQQQVQGVVNDTT